MRRERAVCRFGANQESFPGEVAALLISELSRLSSKPVADAELTPRKAVLIGGFGRNLETTDGLVLQVASLALYGLSLDEINNYIRNVQAVTAADVQRFAGSRLPAKDAHIIIVGNAKDFWSLTKAVSECGGNPLTELISTRGIAQDSATSSALRRGSEGRKQKKNTALRRVRRGLPLL